MPQWLCNQLIRAYQNKDLRQIRLLNDCWFFYHSDPEESSEQKKEAVRQEPAPESFNSSSNPSNPVRLKLVMREASALDTEDAGPLQKAAAALQSNSSEGEYSAEETDYVPADTDRDESNHTHSSFNWWF